MKSSACRAILLDLDGTLVDSYLDADQCWTEWAVSVGVSHRFDLSKYYGRQRAEIVRDLLPELPEDEVTEHAERVRLAERGYTSQTVALPGARELLQSLPHSNWAVVTSNDTEVARARLLAAGLPVPSVLVSADDVERGKPHPEGFLQAARRLGIEPGAAVAVDDSPIGIKAANAAGMVSIAVRFRHDDDSLREADAVFDDVGSIPIQFVHDEILVYIQGDDHDCENCS